MSECDHDFRFHWEGMENGCVACHAEYLAAINAELLAACKKVKERLDYVERKDVYVNDDSRIIMQSILRTAIAKATGANQ